MFKELQESITSFESEMAKVKEIAETMAIKRRADGGGAFKSKYEEEHWQIENDGGIYSERWENFYFDENTCSIGNCFPTKQAGKDTIRVLKLIQKVGVFIEENHDELLWFFTEYNR